MEQFFLQWMNEESILVGMIQLLVMVIVSMIPLAPIPVIALFIASTQGLIVGFIINMGGTLVGSFLLYLLSKNLLKRMAQKMVTRYKGFHAFLDLIQSNGFLAVLIGRLVPVLPSAGVSLISGVSGVKLSSFLLATLLGKFPTILAFSFAGTGFTSGNLNTLILVTLYFLVLMLIARKVKNKWTSNV
ncbi:MAG: VTT domain-containing protein [Solibacillus sp.]|uniref:TVP38/TMEM64 family protein n=1 Tax=unclassified Solibacillus TaxID=2637870 RepID=UPI0030F51965